MPADESQSDVEIADDEAGEDDGDDDYSPERADNNHQAHPETLLEAAAAVDESDQDYVEEMADEPNVPADDNDDGADEDLEIDEAMMDEVVPDAAPADEEASFDNNAKENLEESGPGGESQEEDAPMPQTFSSQKQPSQLLRVEEAQVVCADDFLSGSPARPHAAQPAKSSQQPAFAENDAYGNEASEPVA